MATRVFLHTQTAGAAWENSGRTFLRVPTVGEYVTTRDDGPLHRVVLVVHCPHDDATYAAEVYAVEAGALPEIIAAATAGR